MFILVYYVVSIYVIHVFYLTFHQEQVIIKTFIQKGKAELAAKTGRAHAMKYDGGFVMQCLLMKMKSSTTYAHIRKNNI